MIDVAQDVRLRSEALGPRPFLLQLIGERIGILKALDVAARARIAVPEPRPANVAPGFQHLDLQSQLSELVERIQSGESRAHHDGIKLVTFATDPPGHLHLS